MKPIKLLTIALLLSGCQKDYSVKPSPFHKGDYVRLHGVNPSKSFVPHCGDPSMRFLVTNEYTIAEQRYWYYDLKSDDGCVLLHAENEQLKKW